MKKLYILFMLVFSYTLNSQSLSLFSIDTSKFTTLRARFYAFDEQGKQILNLSPGDFELIENGIERKVTYISCPTPKPPQPISSVLTIDISGSMAGTRLDQAKAAAVAWIDALPVDKSECAVTSFTSSNMLHQDFTNDKQRLKDAVLSMFASGGTDFNAGFINPMAGALLTVQRGKNKRVVVFLTDGHAQGNENEIVQKANEIGAVVYCVILGTSCPSILRNIADRTGGQWFENVTTEDEAKEIYLKILTIAQSLEPCTIEWESAIDCNSIRTIALNLKIFNSTTIGQYSAPMYNVSKIEYSPSPSIKFGIIDPPFSETKEIILTAGNRGVTINSINLTNPQEYEIVDWDGSPPPFAIIKDRSRKLKVKFSPKSSGYSFCRFELDYNACYGNTFFATGGNFDADVQAGGLKLTFPNGGETFVSGADTVITWDGILPEDIVSLDYSIDNGSKWVNITNLAKNLKFNWNDIPNTPSNKCLMKVKQISNVSYSAGDLIKLLGFGRIYDVAYSPNSNRIALANNNLVNLVNLKNNSIIRTFSAGTDNVLSVAFSPDGGKIACGTQSGNIKCWDAYTGKVILNFNSYSGYIYTLTFSPDANWILAGGTSLNIFDANTGLKVRNFSGFSGWIYSASFSNDGNKIVSGGFDKIVHVWDVVTGTESQTFTGHTGIINVVAFSPDGSRIASAGEDASIILWRVKTGELIYNFTGHTQSVNDLIFTSDGNKLISGSSDGNIKIWQVKYGTEYKNYSEDSHAIKAISLSPDGKKIASASEILKIWDIDSAKVVTTIAGHRNEVNAVALSPDNSIIASGGDDNSIILWDLKTGANTRTLKGHSNRVLSLAFNSDGSKLVSGGNDFKINLWDMRTGNLIRSYINNGHSAAILDVDFSPKGDKIVSGSIDNTVKIWDANSPTLLHDITDINSGVYTVAYNPEGTIIASSGSEKIIRLWDANTGAELKKITGIHTGSIHSVCFSPDGTKLASGSIDQSIQITNINSGAIEMTLKGHVNGVTSVRFNSIGNRLVSGGFDKNIKVWDLLSGSELITFKGHQGFVESVDISTDGGKVISGSSDWTVGIWAVIDQTEDNGQEDDSDSLWSIVAPKTASLDVDMGKVLTATMKDSLVKDFIRNEGSWEILIDTIYISGADANSFAVVSGFENFKLEPLEKHESVFRFNPKEEKLYQADIIIITQSDTLIQKIRGQGVEPQIKIVTDLVDFGKVYLNYYKDTTVTAVIENISQEIIDFTKVENAGPDKKQFSIISGGGSFTLNPGESREMELRFTAKELGRTSGSLAFHHANTGSPAKVQLFGEAYKVIPMLTSNSPICIGHDLYLYSDSVPGGKYHWSGPNGFVTDEQNIIIKNAGTEHSGIYSLYVTLGEISSDTTYINVEINIDRVSPGDSSLIFAGTTVLQQAQDDTDKIENYILLTESRPWIAGSVWLKNRFSVKQDFSTTFEFEIKYGDNRQEPEKSLPGADGFAFVMQNHNYPSLGNKGEAMGFNGITNSLAIEFDLFKNTYDPNGNHIAVQSMGAFPNTPDHRISNSVLGMNKDIMEIMQDLRYFVKIEYKHSIGELNIYMDTTEVFNNAVITINNIDMTEYLNLENDEYVYIGFSGATGQACQEHRIYNWEVPCANQYVGVDDGERQMSEGREGNKLYYYPNPAFDLLNIEYSIANAGNVSIEVFDVLGNKIKVVDYGFVGSGRHHVVLSLSKDEQNGMMSFPSGMYYLVLKTSDGLKYGKFGFLR